MSKTQKIVNAVTGEATVIPYDPPVEDPAVVSARVRAKRSRLLSSSDWTQVADAPVDQTSWATYRQELRDITSQAGFPTDVVWPTEPN